MYGEVEKSKNNHHPFTKQHHITLNYKYTKEDKYIYESNAFNLLGFHFKVNITNIWRKKRWNHIKYLEYYP